MTNKNKSGKNKRTKDEASPGSLSNQPDKILVMSNQPSPPAQTTQFSGTYPGTPIMMNPNQQMFGQFYPPHLQFVTPQQTVLQTSETSGSPSAASPEQVTLTSILTKLTKIEQRFLNWTESKPTFRK